MMKLMDYHPALNSGIFESKSVNYNKNNQLSPFQLDQLQQFVYIMRYRSDKSQVILFIIPLLGFWAVAMSHKYLSSYCLQLDKIIIIALTIFILHKVRMFLYEERIQFDRLSKGEIKCVEGPVTKKEKKIYDTQYSITHIITAYQFKVTINAISFSSYISREFTSSNYFPAWDEQIFESFSLNKKYRVYYLEYSPGNILLSVERIIERE